MGRDPWAVQAFKNGDFEVQYPDNTVKVSDTNKFQSAPTSRQSEQKEKVYADMVEEPQHYKIFPNEEVIDLIRKCLTKEEFEGYCKGNIIKYRLRDKHDREEDYRKSRQYMQYLKDI